MASPLLELSITPQQLQFVRNPPKSSMTQQGNLAEVLGISTTYTEMQQRILMDLYILVLRLAMERGFDDQQTCVLMSIIKAVHDESIGKRLTVDNSFSLFKKLMLQHSVHRPPYSVGIFNFLDMDAIVDWTMAKYYAHYKMFIYVFTPRMTQSITVREPGVFVEAVPLLQPLAPAIPEEQYNAEAEERQKKAEEDARVVEEEKAAKSEELRQATLREEYEAAIPEEIKRRVQEAVNMELEKLRETMKEQFQQQETELKAKIEALEAAAKQ